MHDARAIRIARDRTLALRKPIGLSVTLTITPGEQQNFLARGEAWCPGYVETNAVKLTTHLG